MKSKTLAFKVPQSLQDMPLILNTIGEELHAKNHADKYLHFISMLHYRTVKLRYSDDQFVSLHSQNLEDSYGSHHYPAIIKNLLSLGIIERTPGYTTGVQSYGYRITQKYADEPKVKVVAKRGRFANKVLRADQKRTTKIIAENKLSKRTHQWLKDNLAHLDLPNPGTTFNALLFRLWHANHLTESIESYMFQPDISLKNTSLPVPALRSPNVPITTHTNPIMEEFSHHIHPVNDPTFPTIHISQHNYKEETETRSPLCPANLLQRIENVRLETRFLLALWDVYPSWTIEECLSAEPYSWYQFNSDLDWLDMFLTREHYYEIDTFGGRLHTPFSCMSSHLRRYLTLYGEPIVGVDIANSQPLLLGLSIINDLEKQRKNWRESCDVSRYITLCLQGNIYEFLMEELGIDKSDQVLRNKFKKDFFGRVFFNENPKKDEPYFKQAQVFAECFAHVWKIVKQKKSRNYKDLAQGLQRTESDLILNNVCKKLAQHKLYMKAITLHDAIYTTQANVHVVKKILEQQFQTMYEVIPKITIEDPRKSKKDPLGDYFEQLALDFMQSNREAILSQSA
jgi:hypothetical protein